MTTNKPTKVWEPSHLPPDFDKQVGEHMRDGLNMAAIDSVSLNPDGRIVLVIALLSKIGNVRAVGAIPLDLEEAHDLSLDLARCVRHVKKRMAPRLDPDFHYSDEDEDEDEPTHPRDPSAAENARDPSAGFG